MLTLNRQNSLQTVLTQRPLGLVFDIDGTLSPIAPTPGQAKLHPEVRSLLESAKKYTRIAIMTGRAIEDGAEMVGVDGLTYIGTHGVEWSDGLPSTHSVQIVPEAVAYIEPGTHLLDLAEEELSDIPGLIIECKPVGGSIHCRLCPDPEQARRKIRALLEEPAKEVNMRLSDGKQVIDIKAPLAANKGRALRRFVQRFGLRGVVFAGDDRTDLDAIAEIARLREEGIAALAVAVQHSDSLPELLERADLKVQGVDGMVRLLREIVELLKTK
jgi:trehalose 6-phosphate phosphatase